MKKELPVNVTVTRRFGASPERVFDAWLDPGQAGKWLFATPTGQMVRVEIDARVGGRFVFTDRRDGEDIDHVGEYLAIDQPHRLEFVFAVPKFSAAYTRVNVEIAALGNECELTLTHDNILPDYADRTESGWHMLLEHLSTALA